MRTVILYCGNPVLQRPETTLDAGQSISDGRGRVDRRYCYDLCEYTSARGNHALVAELAQCLLDRHVGGLELGCERRDGGKSRSHGVDPVADLLTNLSRDSLELRSWPGLLLHGTQRRGPGWVSLLPR